MSIRPSVKARQPCEIVPLLPSPVRRHGAGTKLRGKVILINASDTTLAGTVACQLAAEGARIVLCNIPDGSDASVISCAISAHGHDCGVVGDRCDNSHACRRLVESVVAQQGAVDVLINCGSTDGSQEEDSIGGIEAVFRSSTFPYFYLMSAALPYLPGGGSIINSCTLHRRSAAPDQAAAEGAIIALTQSFSAAATRRGIRVNAVSRASTGSRSGGDRHFPGAGRCSEAANFGSAWLFLACGDSVGVSGKTFST